MKKLFIIILVCLPFVSNGQFSIAANDSVSVMPGTIFTLQENLVNDGKIYNGGTLLLNGTNTQNLYGTGSIGDLTIDNQTILQNHLNITHQLNINAGKKLALNNFDLLVTGDLTTGGQITTTPNSSIWLSGDNATRNLLFDPTTASTTNALKTISISGNNSTTQIQNKLFVYESMLPNSGTVNLSEEVILRSNATTTARVGIVGASINYSGLGKFVVERYIPGRRAWRLLTTPLTPASAVKISDAWQDGAPRVTNVNDINSTNNPNPGYGTHITFGTPATNGYDQGINGNTSIRYLNSTGWNGVPTATNNGAVFNSGLITDQPGYMLFVRGDRSTPLWLATSAVTTPTVLRPKGKINTGTLNLSLSSAFNNGGGNIFRVVNNPYPSPINFHQIATNPVNAANGIVDAFYLWDPTITGNNGVGGFVGLSYNATASAIAGQPVYDRSTISAIDNTGNIQSSSAFVINYGGSATSIRIEENNKTAGVNPSQFRPAQQLSIQLLAINQDGTISLNDGVLCNIDDNEVSEVNNQDLIKLSNFAENIAIQQKGQLLCIEKRAPLQPEDTIQLYLSKMKVKYYQLQLTFNNLNFPQGSAAFLKDNYLHQLELLSNNDSNRYTFNIINAPASYDSNRLSIIFKRVNKIEAFSGQWFQGISNLQWQLGEPLNIQQFIIERSRDTLQFEEIGQTNSQSKQFADPLTEEGVWYYR
ncbi:MAG: hypothetical protein RLY16_1085, partial [Bacteroidota bacterium]